MYLLILEEDGQEIDHLYPDKAEAYNAFNAAKERTEVFSVALFLISKCKLLHSFKRE